jgi:hypothetical protein
MMKTLLSLVVIFALLTMGFPDTSVESRTLATGVFWFGGFLLGQYGVVVGGLALLGLYTVLK